MTAIVDYGVGNLFSLSGSFAEIGMPATVTGDPDAIRKADRIVLPGVGAFADAAGRLRVAGLDAEIRERAEAGVPILGICLGMQLLFEKSTEYGSHRGLGLIPGTVEPLRGHIPDGLKIPHIGWEPLIFPEGEKSRLYDGVESGECVYFVHSYYARTPARFVSAYAEYGAPVTASAEYENVFGTQFHPEKSGKTGLMILKNFAKIG